MSRSMSRNSRRSKIHGRIRSRISGSAERPRFCVFRSLRHTYAQLIDDQLGQTLVSASTVKLDGNGSNTQAAKLVGKAIAEAAKKKGIEGVVFDRAGYIFHGRVKALADAAREAGLKF